MKNTERQMSDLADEVMLGWLREGVQVGHDEDKEPVYRPINSAEMACVIRRLAKSGKSVKPSLEEAAKLRLAGLEEESKTA
jgi:hypothetical protein